MYALYSKIFLFRFISHVEKIVNLGQSVTQVLFKVISDILTRLSKYSFIEETKKKKEKRINIIEEKEIPTFTIRNIKIMVEKSFTYARVLSNKCRM
jgi:hypothetical protein